MLGFPLFAVCLRFNVQIHSNKKNGHLLVARSLMPAQNVITELQTGATITPLAPLGLSIKCQNPKAARDHNKLIINRKWLHYGLKDRRERSLVTPLTQIHTFLQGLRRAGSPPWTLCSPVAASAQGRRLGHSWD